MGNKKITHPKDIEYFTEYPAPIMESVHANHFTNINSTITFFGPMLYFLTRALCCEQVLEIGHAEGYSSFYLAHAVKDNGVRFNMKGNMYHGIDIVQTEKVRKNLTDAGLPNTILNLDSMELKPETFNKQFDLIFQDGCHDTEHVLAEMENMYPTLKGEGKGYWIFHDCYGPAEEGFRELVKLIEKGKYNFEWCTILCVYGLAILRKMDGYDYNKRHWVP